MMNVDKLIAQIDEAFDGVEVGDGIGLWEADGIDDHEDEQTLKRLRAKDEKHDWRRVDAESLERCECSLSFLDAAGMRFYLPAFLVADLKGRINCDLTFHLAYLNEYTKAQFDALSLHQKEAIAAHLKWYLQSDHFVTESEQKDIERALETFWERI